MVVLRVSLHGKQQMLNIGSNSHKLIQTYRGSDVYECNRAKHESQISTQMCAVTRATTVPTLHNTHAQSYLSIEKFRYKFTVDLSCDKHISFFAF